MEFSNYCKATKTVLRLVSRLHQEHQLQMKAVQQRMVKQSLSSKIKMKRKDL